MSDESKKEAYRKVDNMKYNLVYDTWLEDDNALDRMYANFEFGGKDRFQI